MDAALVFLRGKGDWIKAGKCEGVPRLEDVLTGSGLLVLFWSD
ncbi:hypothetical protein [Phyllobacterium lublinensis]|nr:hypothetical protein [Phyllobacterium sp. 2063]